MKHYFTPTQENKMYPEISQLRDVGQINISKINTSNISFEQVLNELGLFTNKSSLLPIDFKCAVNIITSMLHKDLAYNSEIIPKSQAYSFANKILSDFYTDGCELFTNATWSSQKETGSQAISPEMTIISWNPMTSATFDTGVIIKHTDYCFCIWVRDED